jgi:hypothetical protein
VLSPDKKTALVIGHPGHELRVFHWLETMRPEVFVITDGSGRSGHSRLSSTTRILDQVGARRGGFYGPLSDSAAYAAILNKDFAVYLGLMRTLARYLIDEEVSCVVGDALEGYNPTHDVCRLLIGGAVEIARRATGREIENFEFMLTGQPDSRGNCEDGRDIRVDLDDAAFERKMAVARSYPELESEVNEAIRLNQLEAFRVECLIHVPNHPPVFSPDHKPYYEQFGEERVSSGLYQHVIRYSEHLMPLGEAIWRHVDADLNS